MVLYYTKIYIQMEKLQQNYTYSLNSSILLCFLINRKLKSIKENYYNEITRGVETPKTS
jgi:hypothetical protein